MSEDGRSRYPPSLTSRELKDIQQWERRHRVPVVRRLLWEVFRLRAVALTAHQYEGMTRDQAFQTAKMIGEILRRDLDKLAIIQERKQQTMELLNVRAPRDKKAREERG